MYSSMNAATVDGTGRTLAVETTSVNGGRVFETGAERGSCAGRCLQAGTRERERLEREMQIGQGPPQSKS